MSLQPPKIVATGSSVITRLNRRDIEPVLMPGQKVRVQLGQQYSIYQVPRYDAPETLPPVFVNVASFGSPLAVMVDSGAQSVLQHEMEEWDIVSPGLAQYRLFAVTPGVQWEVKQPAVVSKFVNKNGAIKLDWSTSFTDFTNGNFGMLPEIWTFGDQTTIQVTATNMDMNRNKPVATLAAFGYRYPLQFIETRETPSGDIVYRSPDGRDMILQTVMTVNVGQTQGR
jgi:hypothetical protein